MTTFTKDMLRTGVRVVTAKGKAFIYIEDLNSFVGEQTARSLGSYDNTLQHLGNTNDTVCEIYRGYVFDLFLNIDALGTFIWKREDKSPEQIQLDLLLKQISELNAQAIKLQEIINVKA